MRDRAAIVLDLGKTLSKLTLWAPGGRLLDRRSRRNERIEAQGYLGLDASGIERWLGETLAEFGHHRGDVDALIPVAHGAAAALVGGNGLVQPPLDYEHPIPQAERHAYDTQREPFALTGSPALPDGLNLGAQLHFLEGLRGGPLPESVTLVPWAQYWSWMLSGVASSDVTNLGCHTDLWYPLAGTHSKLSIARKWAARLAPLVASDTVLGTLTPRWSKRTGLPPQTQVYCGLHDSNAALLAARAYPEIAGHEATVLSTGTWFVAMRTPSDAKALDIASLSETRDCLVNVDALGRPIPSARFMGGREIEILAGGKPVDVSEDQPALLRAVPEVLASGSMALPTFAPGTGPFPDGPGRWISAPEDDTRRLAAACLYAALVADASLDLIGAKDRLLIEGRFARADVFTRALAALRPTTTCYVAHAESDVSFGALRLLDPDLPPPSSLTRVTPLAQDLRTYRERWRQESLRAIR
jgi:sugar (pentulose or hexulose) kinase